MCSSDLLSAALLLGIPVAYLVAFFLVPFGSVIVTSVSTPTGEPTLGYYAKIVFDIYYWETLGRTFQIALWTTLAVLIIGYPLAYTMTFNVKKRIWRRAIFVIIVTPLFTSSIVRAFGWLVLLGRKGFVNESLISLGLTETPLQLLYNETAIVIGMTYIMVPFMVLTVASGNAKLVALCLGAGIALIGGAFSLMRAPAQVHARESQP
mgnify:CR=1 FL=1